MLKANLQGGGRLLDSFVDRNFGYTDNDLDGIMK